MFSNCLKACMGLWLVLGCVMPVSGQQKSLQVTFINPGISNVNDPTGGFWVSASEFMRAVADALHIDLEILYAERDHVLMQKQAEEVAARPNHPDYLIVVNEKLAAGRMLESADAAGIKTLLMANAFVGEQAARYGQPRDKYPHWLGTLTPDAVSAGQLIAQRVIEHALAANVKAADGTLHLVAIAGDHATQASTDRVQGLQHTVAQYPNVSLKQVVFGEWRKDLAYERTLALLKRYPEVGAIWAANDPMALGALQAAVETGKQPGKTMFIGGLNWDPPALEKTKEGLLVTTVGGHFMIGGWALVLLYDYHHGRDFAEEGLQLQPPMFAPLHADNIDVYLTKLGGRHHIQK